METYNFDEIIDRKGSNAVKSDALEECYCRADLIPLWIADMDFATPPEIIVALKKRLEHPILGYTFANDSYFDSILNWLKTRHDWKVKREEITYIPGIVRGIGLAINLFTEIGDKIIIQPPVYNPFHTVSEDNHRKVIYNPLKLVDGHYEMDFAHLESVIDDCKILILSNPHNPGGSIWGKKTLEKLADICYENNTLVISDEIHSDLALFGNKHIPFATVSKKAKQNSITFAAPSKTFNIAGIVSSYAVVQNLAIRDKFYSWLETNELDRPTIFATIAAEAAYTQCNEWHSQLIKYLENNILFVENYINEHCPKIHAMRPQASFLVWLDCRELGLSHDELVDLFVNKAKLALNDGEVFGIGGEGFMRLNIGCPRSVLKKALDQLFAEITH